MFLLAYSKLTRLCELRTLAMNLSLALSLSFGLVSPAAAQAAGDYAVGDRLAAPAQPGTAQAGKIKFRELSWDDLIPDDWDPQKFFDDLQLDELEDNDPRALEIMARMRTEWDRAPVVERLSGQSVRLPGFVVPLESDGRTIREFLLVPYFGACVHVPPPPANQLIHVIAEQPIPAGMNMTPVWVDGVMQVGRIESELGNAGYQLRAVKIVEYEEEAPR